MKTFWKQYHGSTLSAFHIAIKNKSKEEEKKNEL